MGIKNIDDIERERAKRERDEFTKDISEDINKVLKNIFPKTKKPVKKKKIRWKIIKILGFIFLLIFMINLVLGNFWLLKFFIKSLIFGG